MLQMGQKVGLFPRDEVDVYFGATTGKLTLNEPMESGSLRKWQTAKDRLKIGVARVQEYTALQ